MTEGHTIHRLARHHKPSLTVAVVGAGIAGLTCARALTDAGLAVTVFDKGRGPGGRMSTRRTESGLTFDHGCQYFSAKDEQFIRAAQLWLEAGVVDVWNGRVVHLDHGRISERNKSSQRFVGVPGMNAVGKHMASDLNVRSNSRVDSLRKDDSGWTVVDSEGLETGSFDATVVSLPAPQAVQLLEESKQLAAQAAGVTLAPCWATMIAFGDKLGFPADAAFVHDSAISWISRNSSKPRRDLSTDCWVIHASAEWSSANIDRPADSVVEILLSEFFKSLGLPAVAAIHRDAHRWMFANPTQALSAGCLFDRDILLGASGDWCLGNRVEAAFLSGTATAKQLMDCISQRS